MVAMRFSSFSKTQFTQSGVCVWTPSERPLIFAFRLFDCQIIDGSESLLHQTVTVELPVFVAIGTKPVAVLVAAFVSETDCDAISIIGPKFFDQSIIEFFRPLALKESNNLCPSI